MFLLMYIINVLLQYKCATCLETFPGSCNLMCLLIISFEFLPTIRSYFPCHLIYFCVNSIVAYSYDPCHLYIFKYCMQHYVDFSTCFFHRIFSVNQCSSDILNWFEKSILRVLLMQYRSPTGPNIFKSATIEVEL